LSLGESLIYLVNPVRQFSEFTNKSANLDEMSGVYMSAEYLEKSEFNEGESVRIKSDRGEIVAKIVSDNKIGGSIICLPTFDSKLNSEALFSGYRFNSASIERV
jgi:NADH-quinone oxidoreductase subunit G